jgi:hypothetical protein
VLISIPETNCQLIALQSRQINGFCFIVEPTDDVSRPISATRFHVLGANLLSLCLNPMIIIRRSCAKIRMILLLYRTVVSLDNLDDCIYFKLRRMGGYKVHEIKIGTWV